MVSIKKYPQSLQLKYSADTAFFLRNPKFFSVDKIVLGTAQILQKLAVFPVYVAIACQHCLSLQHKRVTPHVLRHSAAMELLQSGVDCAVIALWLGHESMDTTQIYLHASLELKERALEKTTPINGYPGRYRPDDDLMAFLKGL